MRQPKKIDIRKSDIVLCIVFAAIVGSFLRCDTYTASKMWSVKNFIGGCIAFLPVYGVILLVRAYQNRLPKYIQENRENRVAQMKETASYIAKNRAQKAEQALKTQEYIAANRAKRDQEKSNDSISPGEDNP